MAAPSVPIPRFPPAEATKLPDLAPEKYRFFALMQGSQSDFEAAKLLFAENEPLRTFLIRNNSFDPFIQQLLEDEANRNRFLHINRIFNLMSAYECRTPFAEIAQGLSLIRYKRIEEAIAHIHELWIDELIHPRILSQVVVYRAGGQRELAALFENFAAHMLSVRRAGKLAEVIHPSLADLGRRV